MPPSWDRRSKGFAPPRRCRSPSASVFAPRSGRLKWRVSPTRWWSDRRWSTRLSWPSHGTVILPRKFWKPLPASLRLCGRREPPDRDCRPSNGPDRRQEEQARATAPAGRHMRIRPSLRFAYTFDGGRCKGVALPKTPDDPLGFTYGKSYRESLAAARKATGETDAMALAEGEIGGVPTVVLVQDFAFMGGSLGAAAR